MRNSSHSPQSCAPLCRVALEVSQEPLTFCSGAPPHRPRNNPQESLLPVLDDRPLQDFVKEYEVRCSPL